MVGAAAGKQRGDIKRFNLLQERGGLRISGKSFDLNRLIRVSSLNLYG